VLKPFRSGTGRDIAPASIRSARSVAGPEPLIWRHGAIVSVSVLSCEVIYLLPDLAARADGIRVALRPGGVS
jgi:hypothetical protein